MTVHADQGTQTPDTRVGEAARFWMFRRHMTQTALARAVGVTQSVLSKKMRGDVGWSVADLVAVAAALSVEPAVLLAGVGALHADSPRHDVTGTADLSYTTRDLNPEPAD